MASSDDVRPIFDIAVALLDEKEKLYGDAWKTNGKQVCISEVFRKANYIRVQWENKRITTEKLQEDLLDLMNWAAFAYFSEETKK
jgi:hypothetical protein